MHDLYDRQQMRPEKLDTWRALRRRYGNRLLVLKPSAAQGRAAGVDIDYTSGGTSYIWRSNFAIVVKVKPGHC